MTSQIFIFISFTKSKYLEEDERFFSNKNNNSLYSRDYFQVLLCGKKIPKYVNTHIFIYREHNYRECLRKKKAFGLSLINANWKNKI